MALSMNGVSLKGASLGAPTVSIPFVWDDTYAGAAWTVSSDVATTTSNIVVSGEILHGPLLLAGTYCDVYMAQGYATAYVGFLGVGDNFGSYDYNTSGPNTATWYWSGAGGFVNGSVQVGAPAALLGGARYRIASKSGGVIVMSRVSLDGLTIVPPSLTMTMAGGYNAANLHVILMSQPGGYYAPGATGYNVNSGSGGL